uniref:DUF7164 domain-containing protein n=1 Tax=Trichuris muris TaxID=70415 RepID=A0A5S6R0K0_TRIMR
MADLHWKKLYDYRERNAVNESSINFGGLRIGVLTVLPNQQHLEFVVQLATFLYSSWIHMIENINVTNNVSNSTTYNKIDLLIFTEKKNLEKLLPGCILVQHQEQLETTRPQCLYLATTEINHPYTFINTYAFLNSPLFRNVTSAYDYLLRTDLDVFLSPTLLTYRPTRSLITGKGGYCVNFTKGHLVELAQRLGYQHRHIHNLGSTWFGKAELLANLSFYASELSMKIYDTEFDPKLHPEIAKFMSLSDNGKWAEWWRPTSSMYAQELVLNQFLQDLSSETVRGGLLDVESCRSSKISNHLHVHTWHGKCEFNKFNFLNEVVHKHLQSGKYQLNLRYAKRKAVDSMPVKEYCRYITQHALFNLAEWFAQYTDNE